MYILIAFKKPEHFLYKDRVSFNSLLFIGDKQLFLNVTKCFPEFEEIYIERQTRMLAKFFEATCAGISTY